MRKILLVPILDLQDGDIVRLNGWTVERIEQPYTDSKVRIHYTNTGPSPWYDYDTEVSVTRVVPTKRFRVDYEDDTEFVEAENLLEAAKIHPDAVCIEVAT